MLHKQSHKEKGLVWILYWERRRFNDERTLDVYCIVRVVFVAVSAAKSLTSFINS